MRRALLAITLGLCATTHAGAQTSPPRMSAQRLYALCFAQDPQCMSTLHGLVRQITELNPGCRQTPVPDEMLYGSFMQYVGRDPSWFRFSALTVESAVYSSLTGCVHKVDPVVEAEAPQRPGPRTFQVPVVTEDQARKIVKRLAFMNPRCARNDSGACEAIKEDTAYLHRRNWCIAEGADIGSFDSWHPCTPPR